MKPDRKKIYGVTLACIDCVDVGRTLAAVNFSLRQMSFEEVLVLTSLDYSGVEKDLCEGEFVKIKHLNSTPEYSDFVLKELYKYINTSFCLIVQYDGFILNAKAWTDDFLDYDYIGAPWMLFNNTDPLYGLVGNGGFSLRSKRFLEVIAKDDTIHNIDYEDRTICYNFKNYLEERGLKFCPVEVARNFSIEGGKWQGELGFHSFVLTEIPDFAFAGFPYARAAKEWIISYHRRFFETQVNNPLNYIKRILMLNAKPGKTGKPMLVISGFERARNILLHVQGVRVRCFMVGGDLFLFWYLKCLAKARGIDLDLHFFKDRQVPTDAAYSVIYADANVDRTKVKELMEMKPGWDLVLQGAVPTGATEKSGAKITYAGEDVIVISKN